MMNLYKIWQTVNNGYDTYDSAVVVAKSADAARHIHPTCVHEDIDDDDMKDWWKEGYGLAIWALPENIQVSYLGKASPRWKENTVFVASFNAG
jgi:hypothetical protein